MNNKEFARNMRENVFIDRDVIHVTLELWETVASKIEQSIPIKDISTVMRLLGRIEGAICGADDKVQIFVQQRTKEIAAILSAEVE